jgi:20S proteasome alpha/beta subunit
MVASFSCISLLFGSYWLFLQSFLFRTASIKLFPSVSAASSAAVAPWQEGNSARRIKSPFGNHLPSNTFAPDGRLYDIEDVTNAIVGASNDDPSSNTVVVIRCRDGVVAVTSVPPSPYIPHRHDSDAISSTLHPPEDEEIDSLTEDLKEGAVTESPSSISLLLDMDDWRQRQSPTAVPPFCRLCTVTPVLAVTVGNAVDAQLLRHRLLHLVEDIRNTEESISSGSGGMGRDVPSFTGVVQTANVARRLADQNQLRTIELKYGRALAAGAVLFSGRDNGIWRVDPAGQFWKCQACVLGRYTSQVESLLLEKLQTSQQNRFIEEGSATESKSQSPSDTMSALSRDETLTALSTLSVQDGLILAAQCIQQVYDSNLASTAANVKQPQQQRRVDQKGGVRETTTTATTLSRRSRLLLRAVAISTDELSSGGAVRSHSHRDLEGMIQAS